MNIAICDDEKCMVDFLQERVRKLFPEAVIQTFSSGEELLAGAFRSDILLLDIQMQGLNGMDTAQMVRERQPETVIIFVTADDSFVFDAFDVRAFHYLLKPFTEEKFAEVLTGAVQCCQERNLRNHQIPAEEKTETARMITVQHKGVHFGISFDEIVYAEVYNRKVVIHTTGRDIEYYGKLTELAKKLGEDFFQTHRAYLVHLKYVTKYDANSVTLKGGTALMSKANFPKFVKSYLKYNQRCEKNL